MNKLEQLKGNFLIDMHPEIVIDLWDFEKNELLPEEISAESNKKVWWKGFRNKVSIKAMIEVYYGKDR